MANASPVVDYAIALYEQCRHVSVNCSQCRLLSDRIEHISTQLNAKGRNIQILANVQRLFNELHQFIAEFEGEKDERLLSRVKHGFSHCRSDQERFEECNRRLAELVQSMQPGIVVDFESERVKMTLAWQTDLESLRADFGDQQDVLCSTTSSLSIVSSTTIGDTITSSSSELQQNSSNSSQTPSPSSDQHPPDASNDSKIPESGSTIDPEEMYNFLRRNTRIRESDCRQYANMIKQANAPSVSRLRNKLSKKPNFLSSVCNIDDDDDIEQIKKAVTKFMSQPSPSNQAISLPTPPQSSAKKNINVADVLKRVKSLKSSRNVNGIFDILSSNMDESRIVLACMDSIRSFIDIPGYVDSRELSQSHCDILIQSVSRYQSDATIIGSILRCVEISARNDTNSPRLSAVCPLLPLVLSAHMDCIKVVNVACLAVANVTGSDANVQRLSDVCPLLPSVLSRYMDDVELMFHASWAIANLSNNNPINRQRLAEVCPLLSSVLSARMNSYIVVPNLCRAIAHLSDENESNCQSLIECCSLLPVVFCRYLNNFAVIKNACLAVANLSNNNIANCERLSDVCPLLPPVISAYLDNAEVVSYACNAIAHLSANNENRQRLVVVYPILPTILSIHMNNANVMEYACHAIANLSYENDMNNQNLIDCCSLMPNVLLTYIANDDICSQICTWVVNMSYFGNINNFPDGLLDLMMDLRNSDIEIANLEEAINCLKKMNKPAKGLVVGG